LREAALIGALIVRLALLPRANEFQQRGRPDQAADMRGKDARRGD